MGKIWHTFQQATFKKFSKEIRKTNFNVLFMITSDNIPLLVLDLRF